MNIAIFADVHGRILLAFKVVERYQRETGETIDVILQCGDVGIFPDVAALDKATHRIAEHDVSELGFAMHFTTPNPEAEAVLDQLSCMMICVRGNHEDHRYLDGLENQSDAAIFPVDCYHRVWCLKTGLIHRFCAPDAEISLLGIGRVGAPDTEPNPFLNKYIQQHEQDRLAEVADLPFDVLLTHDGRRDFVRHGIGMREIGMILDRQAPAYHFFGHTGQPFQRRTDENGVTVCSKLSDFEWEESDRGGRLKEGCLGVLRWQDANHHRFDVVDAPWIREYTPHTWLYL
ncbi:MAG: metallophosphoesterase [Pirellulaceae bacterium]